MLAKIIFHIYLWPLDAVLDADFLLRYNLKAFKNVFLKISMKYVEFFLYV